jgi:2-polyprenyl-3-methyl-5-hydroxy-6-metoxy-1,4-benzoquinol methylase
MAVNTSDPRSKLRSEFTGQADPLSWSKLFQSWAILDRIGRAVDAGAGDRLLDVACGPGLLGGHLAHRARRVMDLDVTREMLTRARRHALDREGVTLPVVCATADSLHFVHRWVIAVACPGAG